MSGELFEFDVVSCCGFIDVKKVLKKYELTVQRKSLAKITLKQKTRKISTQKLSEEFAFS